MNPILSTHTWVSLPNEVRYKLRSLFQIPRSSNTVVDDGVIITDGTTNEDLQELTTDKMQDYVGSTSTDFHKLFDLTVSQVKDEIANPPVVTTPGLEVAPQIKKKGRPAKNAKHA